MYSVNTASAAMTYLEIYVHKHFNSLFLESYEFIGWHHSDPFSVCSSQDQTVQNHQQSVEDPISEQVTAPREGCDSEEKLCWRNPFLGGLHLMEQAYAGAVCVEMQFMRRTYAWEVHGELSVMEGIPCWSRERPWEGFPLKRKKHETKWRLTTFPALPHCWRGEGSENKEQRRAQGESGGERVSLRSGCIPQYSAMISLANWWYCLFKLNWWWFSPKLTLFSPVTIISEWALPALCLNPLNIFFPPHLTRIWIGVRQQMHSTLLLAEQQ